MPAAPDCSSAAALPTRPTAAPAALTLLDRKRLELARALATGPRVLLLDEVAGGLVEHETAALVDLIKDVRATGVSIIWIEHVVHALIAVVDRLVVLHGGALIARGRSRRGDPPPAGRRDLHGHRGRRSRPMPDRLLEVRALDAHYGDFQALFGVSMRVDRGRGGGGDRRQRRRQDHAAQMHRRRDAGRAATPSSSMACRSAAMPAHEVVARGIAMVPEGRRLFPSLTRRGKSPDRRPARPAGAVESQARLRAVSDAGGAPPPAEPVAVRRPAADGRHRPRADVEPAAAAVRRDQPRPRADRHPRHLRAHSGDRRRGHVAGHRRAGHRAGAEDRAPCLLPAGGPRRAAGRGRRR